MWQFMHKLHNNFLSPKQFVVMTAWSAVVVESAIKRFENGIQPKQEFIERPKMGLQLHIGLKQAFQQR